MRRIRSVRVRLSQKRQPELRNAGKQKRETGRGTGSVRPPLQMAKKNHGQRQRSHGRKQANRLLKVRVGSNPHSPWRPAWQPGVRALGKMSQRQKQPKQGCRSSPCVKDVKHRNSPSPEIHKRGHAGKQKSRPGKRWNCQKQNGVGKEAVQIRQHKQQPGKHKGSDGGENRRIPDRIRRHMRQGSAAEGKRKSGHQTESGQQAKGRQGEMPVVEKNGVHAGASLEVRSQAAPKINRATQSRVPTRSGVS